MDQGQAMASVFHGAARDPENALRLNAQLSEQEPERAQDYGSYLVAAFTRAGEFSQAAAFAAESAPEVRVDWLNAAYSRWAGDQPQAALEHLGKLSNREIRQMAFDAAVSHWAQNKPREVAEYALTLSDGREREFALNAALRAWSSADAVEAATWMGRFEPSPHLDFGAAMIASQPEAMRHPQIATSWAESITDPRLRVAILASVVNEWALTDPVAARHYAEFSPRIWAEDRAGVLFAFEPDFHPISLLP
ncbi:MAG: hypothetical protein H7X95_05575 [Deltaproteobacteria bacterium]|nr:hypothetical protein [Deltaproteobacteria bacterium]